jgi:hypothetical protein
MIGSLSKLQFKGEDLQARLVPRLEGQSNLASAMFALPLRASSQIRPTLAGTMFSKPGGRSNSSHQNWFLNDDR